MEARPGARKIAQLAPHPPDTTQPCQGVLESRKSQASGRAGSQAGARDAQRFSRAGQGCLLGWYCHGRTGIARACHRRSIEPRARRPVSLRKLSLSLSLTQSRWARAGASALPLARGKGRCWPPATPNRGAAGARSGCQALACPAPPTPAIRFAEEAPPPVPNPRQPRGVLF